MKLLVKAAVFSLIALPMAAGATTVFQSGNQYRDRWIVGAGEVGMEFGSAIKLGGTERVLDSISVMYITYNNMSSCDFTLSLYSLPSTITKESPKLSDPFWTCSVTQSFPTSGMYSWNAITFTADPAHPLTLPDSFVIDVREGDLGLGDFLLCMDGLGEGPPNPANPPAVGSLESRLLYMNQQYPSGPYWFDGETVVGYKGALYLDATVTAHAAAVPEPTAILAFSAVTALLALRRRKA